MTFEEVYKQVNRELESQVPTDLVREILVMFFRVILEELLTNKKDAYIYIGGIGRLHLDKRQYKYNPNNVEGGEYWNITFKASKKLKNWRLEDCDIYVTLEPCSMCSGAIIQSRIKNLYFGAFDPKTGACGSVLNLFEHDFNHKVNVIGGVMENECSRIIKDFFKELRQKNIDNNQ